jgi:hypothetical protein
VERPLVDRKPLSQFVELRAQTLGDEQLVQPRPQLRHVTTIGEPSSDRDDLVGRSTPRGA